MFTRFGGTADSPSIVVSSSLGTSQTTGKQRREGGIDEHASATASALESGVIFTKHLSRVCEIADSICLTCEESIFPKSCHCELPHALAAERPPQPSRTAFPPGSARLKTCTPRAFQQYVVPMFLH